MSVNLLPPEIKSDIVFARRNAMLKNWIIASIIGVIGIVLVLAAGHFFISRSTATWQKQVSTMRTQLSAQKQDEVQKQVTSIGDSVKLTLQVLQKQVFFSKLVTQVGAIMPDGTTLDSLTINSTQGGIDLTAKATNYQTATQVQLNIIDPEKRLFEKADIINTTCALDPKDLTSSINRQYPCKITIRAVFAKDNTFQYSKTTPAGAKP